MIFKSLFQVSFLCFTVRKGHGLQYSLSGYIFFPGLFFILSYHLWCWGLGLGFWDWGLWNGPSGSFLGSGLSIVTLKNNPGKTSFASGPCVPSTFFLVIEFRSCWSPVDHKCLASKPCVFKSAVYQTAIKLARGSINFRQ